MAPNVNIQLSIKFQLLSRHSTLITSAQNSIQRKNEH